MKGLCMEVCIYKANNLWCYEHQSVVVNSINQSFPGFKLSTGLVSEKPKFQFQSLKTSGLKK